MSSIVLSLGLSAALATPPGDAEPQWAAPATQSAVDGAYGVAFRPRYSDPLSGELRRGADLHSFESELPSMGPADRHVAVSRLSHRLDAVLHWQNLLLSRATDASLPGDARTSVLHQLDLLAMEEGTLRSQLAMVGGDASPSGHRVHLGTRDVVAFGQDVEVGPDEEIHDVVSFGGDIVVLGHVTGHAVAFGGDVLLRDQGDVLGDVEAFGGHVHSLPLLTRPGSSLTSRAARPTPTTTQVLAGRGASALGVAGISLLFSALWPTRLASIGGRLAARPWASLVLGGLATLAVGTVSILLALTVVGIPVALGLLTGLAAAAVFGGVTLAQTLGRRVLPYRSAGWSQVVVGAAALLAASWLPWVGAALAVGLLTLGVGATLLSRFGTTPA